MELRLGMEKFYCFLIICVLKDEPDLIRNILKRPLNIKHPTISISKLSEDILIKTLTLEEKDRISWQELFQLKQAIEIKI